MEGVSVAAQGWQILVVEDDERTARALARMVDLRRPGSARIAASCAQARGLLSGSARWAGVIVDVRLPDGDGLDLLSDIRRASSEVPALVLTGICRPEVAARAKALGACYVVKPPVGGEVTDFIDRVLAARCDFARHLRDAVARICRRCSLTARQSEILYALALDDRRRSVAAELAMSPSTLKSHLAAMYEHTGAEDLRQLGALVRAEALTGW